MPYDVLPDEDTISTTVKALEARGFGVEVVDDAGQAREAVLTRIPVPDLETAHRRVRGLHLVLVRQVLGY